MAKSGGTTKPPKPTREEKKAARVERRQQRRETWRGLREAFTLTRKRDNRFLPYLIIIFVVIVALVLTIGLLTTSTLLNRILVILSAVIAGLAGGMLFFQRRVQRTTYAEADGTPGAAAWIIDKQLRGEWHTEQAVVATAQMDAVHRLVGRPGIVLVGEGAPQRVRPLIAQEKKRLARIAGDSPIHDVVVGNDEGEVPLRKLNAYVNRLPRSLSKADVAALEKRLSALGTRRMPVPQGPMPAGAKMRNVQRAARRRT